MKPIKVSDDYVLTNCSLQELERLNTNDTIFTLSFKHKKKMTLRKYENLATSAPSPFRSDSSFTEIEDIFWTDWHNQTNLFSNKQTVYYATDNELSLFPDDWPYWNINRLTARESIISDGNPIPGVNTPFTNWAMPFTVFGIHCEDSNLGSINVQHGGAPRQWYSVSSFDSEKLENLVQRSTPEEIDCDLFIRHKSTLIPPSILEENGIPLYKVK